MSEFSDSLHFYDVAESELRALLATRGLKAFILNTESPIAVLMGWEEKEKVHDIGASLDFSYGEDHGLYCKFYKGGALVGRLNVDWGEDSGMDESPDSPNLPGISEGLASVLVRYFLLPKEDADKVESITGRYDLSDFVQREAFLGELGTLLRLKNFRWLSCTDLEHNWDQLLETNPKGAVN